MLELVAANALTHEKAISIAKKINCSNPRITDNVIDDFIDKIKDIMS